LTEDGIDVGRIVNVRRERERIVSGWSVEKSGREIAAENDEVD
jgi:hypothetical protein